MPAAANDRDGGPAFPSWDYALQCDAGGMSLRDYFAAKAMTALLPAFAKGELTPKADGRKVDEDLVAEQAYYFADAMLKARGE